MTHPEVGVPVVRVVVPHLETVVLSKHMGMPSAMGARGRRYISGVPQTREAVA
jgi:ribosomal protein S12 methylthiotransferase accessory factor YcaO